jgi:hypothetical protein
MCYDAPTVTIGTIFERYEVPRDVADEALRRGAYVLALKSAWVGPEVQWPILVKALVFASLGESGAHIRKKVGLDKYIVTLITRGMPKFAETIISSHDIHQKLYVYCLWHDNPDTWGIPLETWRDIEKEVRHNLLHDVVTSQPDQAVLNDIASINILHYKNPSV